MTEQLLRLPSSAHALGEFRDQIPGAAVNRQCASSLAAIAFGAGQIASGMSRAILAGGMESLSTMPVLTKRKAFTTGKEADDYERWSARPEAGETLDLGVALSVGLAMPSTVGCRSMPNSRLRRLLFSYATAELDLPAGLLEERVRRAAARPGGGRA